MKRYLILSLALTAILTSCHRRAHISSASDTSNRAAITKFYSKALTVNSQTRPTKALTPLFAEGYKSSSSVDSKSPEQLMGQLEFFWKLIPDLKWVPQEIINEGDVYVVRSMATGTPKGDFMGLPTDGTKSFNIMTIDKHLMKDGKFVNTYHVEDWVTAMKQLKEMDKPKNNTMDKQSQETLKIANDFMGAMGKGDMEAMMNLMHDDMVWQNAGDKSLPWIGPWNGKKIILEEFMPAFGANFVTKKWEPNDAIANGDTAAYFGQMVGLLTNSNQETEEFTYALRVKVKDGKVILWNWFEDSYEVSRAYHGNK